MASPVTQAQNAAMARARLAAAENPAIVPHGTYGGRTYWGCKCEPCGEAYRLRRALHRAWARQRAGIPPTGWDAEVLAYWETRKAAAA
jgi:hypothetical protein